MGGRRRPVGRGGRGARRHTRHRGRFGRRHRLDDTAEAYGDGRSEELVGAIVLRRPDSMVFTKMAHFASGARAQDVNRAIRGSLRRLRRDHVDLYQIHWPSEHHVPIEETWARDGATTGQGLTRFIGVANFDRPLIERCLAIGHVDSVQNQFPPHAGRPHRAPAVAPGARHRLSGVRPARLRFAHGHFDRDTTFHEAVWRSGAENLGYYEELFPPGRFEEHLGNVDPLRPIAQRVHMDLPTLALRTAIDTPASRRSSRGAARRPTRDPTPRPEPCILTRRRCATSMTSSGLHHRGDRDRAA
jgi:aryl-alcohol dehydrogenase-like predicted oxidoreductase